jgi:hypothetical protein
LGILVESALQHLLYEETEDRDSDHYDPDVHFFIDLIVDNRVMLTFCPDNAGDQLCQSRGIYVQKSSLWQK